MRPFSHLAFAHHLWSLLVQPGDIVVDATAGNGLDSLQLAKLALTNSRGRLIVFDIQTQALINTQQRLATHHLEQISVHKMCHSRMSEVIEQESATLVVFNLGYLPGADKSITTMHTSTLAAIKSSLSLIKLGGAISLTCYPGHAEGQLEEEIIVSFLQTLDPHKWNVSSYQNLIRRTMPHLLFIQRIS